jgi:hypothetical protein
MRTFPYNRAVRPWTRSWRVRWRPMEGGTSKPLQSHDSGGRSAHRYRVFTNYSSQTCRRREPHTGSEFSRSTSFLDGLPPTVTSECFYMSSIAYRAPSGPEGARRKYHCVKGVNGSGFILHPLSMARDSMFRMVFQAGNRAIGQAGGSDAMVVLDTVRPDTPCRASYYCSTVLHLVTLIQT